VSHVVWLAAFLSIKRSQDFLVQKKIKQIDVLERVLEKIVTREDLLDFLNKIERESKDLKKEKNKLSKDRWGQMRAAFGGKEIEED